MKYKYIWKIESSRAISKESVSFMEGREGRERKEGITEWREHIL